MRHLDKRDEGIMLEKIYTTQRYPMGGGYQKSARYTVLPGVMRDFREELGPLFRPVSLYTALRCSQILSLVCISWLCAGAPATAVYITL